MRHRVEHQMVRALLIRFEDLEGLLHYVPDLRRTDALAEVPDPDGVVGEQRNRIDPARVDVAAAGEGRVEGAVGVETGDAVEGGRAVVEFLLAGDVFTEDLIETWLDYKRSSELDAMRLRPHPYEFFMYFDA